VNIDVSKSLHSTTSSSTSSITIDLELEYDAIAVGKLKSLQLFDKKIASFSNIENLDRCYNLIHLNLHSNFIRKIERIQSLKKLKILNLSSNQIEDIQGLEHLECLEELNLSSNKITKITKNCLSSQCNLRKLVLSYNYIHDVSGLNGKYFKGTKLRYLDIKCNQIKDSKQCEHLKHLQSIQTLIVEDNHSSEFLSNPFCAKGYKHIIADILPSLQWLNMEPFDAEKYASKIKLIITSPKKQRKKKQIILNKQKTLKKSQKNLKQKKLKTHKKYKHKKRRKKEMESDENESIYSSSSSSFCSSSEFENDDESLSENEQKEKPKKLKQKISIKPRLISPPKPIDRKKEKKSKKKKKKKRKEKYAESKNDEHDGITPRIDAVLDRFYKRSGTKKRYIIDKT